MTGSSSTLPVLINFNPLLHRSSSPSPIQNANVLTPHEGEVPEKGPKRKGSSGSIVLNKNERPVPRNEEEEEHYARICTELVLYEDKCKIKKELAKTDLGSSSRLLLPLRSVKDHVLPLMDEETKEQVHSKDGMKVVVRNADTRQDHELVFHYWPSSNSYVLKGGWTKQFVKERGLEAGDEIGMFWDTDDRMFHFTVHREVARGPSNVVV